MMSFDLTAMKEVVRCLSDGDIHEIYSFHDKYRLTPVRIIEVLDRLVEIDVISIEGDFVKLKDISDKAALSEIRRYFLDSESNIEDIDAYIEKDERLSVDEPYTPLKVLLDQELIVDEN